MGWKHKKDSDDQRQRREDWFQTCLNPGTLQAAKPAGKEGETVIRLIPEYKDGERLPMVIADSEEGPEFSNGFNESMSINVGLDEKFTGFTLASDQEEGTKDLNKVFSGLYIRLKNRLKNNKVPEDKLEKVKSLFERPTRDGRELPPPLPNSSEWTLVQGIVYVFNGERLPKPKGKQCIFLNPTTSSSVGELLVKAHEDNIDLFDPKEGRLIILKPERSRIGGFMLLSAEMGEATSIPEDTCKKLWTPWSKVIKRYTYDEHLQQAFKCFGRDIIRIAFPDEVAQYEARHEGKASTPEASPERVSEKPESSGGMEIDVDVEGGPLGSSDDSPTEPTSDDLAVKSPEEMKSEYEKLLDMEDLED